MGFAANFIRGLGMLRSFDVGIKNLAICDFEPLSQRVLQWQVVDISGDVIHRLFDLLQSSPQQPDTVVVEAQSKKSAKLLAVQHWIQAFYELAGCPVTIYSARNKLRGTGLECGGRQNYRARKAAAVHLCRTFLRDSKQADDIVSWFEETKKKDDAADSLLMALAFRNIPVRHDVTVPTVKLVARKPTVRQLSRGAYSASNIKHLMLKEHACTNAEQVAAVMISDPRLQRSIRKLWPDPEQCWRAITSC